MTEADFRRAVKEAAAARGLWLRVFPPDKRIPAGWVDMVILGPRGALFAELKTDTGRRSRAQIECGARLETAGLAYRLWTPALWASGAITRDLDAIA